MNEPIRVFVDTSVVIHSVANPNELDDSYEWLKQEIPLIKDIVSLKNKGKLLPEYELNIMIEIHRRARGKEKEIDELWGDIRPSPTFLDFQGGMSNPEEVEEGFTKPMRERKETFKEIFRGVDLDFIHLVHAEFYDAKYFITTDKKFLNKINNNKKGKDTLKVKVLSPSEFLKELNVNLNEE